MRDSLSTFHFYGKTAVDFPPNGTVRFCLKQNGLLFCTSLPSVVRRVDNAIRRINRFSVDSVVCFVNTSPLDSDLSGG